MARAHFGIGLVQQTLGKFEEAEPYFRRAIELEPAFGKAYAALALAQRIEGEDADVTLATLKTELASADLPPTARATFMTAAFRILDKRGEFDEASEYLIGFNRLRDAALNNVQEQQTIMFGRLKSIFTKEFFEQRTEFGNTTEQPVFIIGMPRSGTTLTEQIIASHPRAFGAGELSAIADVLTKARRNSKSELPFPNFIPELPAAELRGMAQEYLAAYPAEAANYDRVTDKMPDNWVSLGQISLLFPNARFIWCRRHPIDTCASCYMQNFAGPLWYSFDQKKLAQRFHDHINMNEFWKSALPNRFHEVRYEDLTQNPEPTIRKLIEFCGLEWDDACLNFHETERVVRTASLWQVRQPMYTSSVGKWKNYEKYLGPLIEELGDLVDAYHAGSKAEPAAT